MRARPAIPSRAIAAPLSGVRASNCPGGYLLAAGAFSFTHPALSSRRRSAAARLLLPAGGRTNSEGAQ